MLFQTLKHFAKGLKKLMDLIGFKTSEESVKKMMDEVDKDKSGEIDFEEFVAVMAKKSQFTFSKQRLKESLKLFEETKDSNEISVATLQYALQTYGNSKLTEEQIEDIIDVLDPEGTQKINFQHLVDVMIDED